MSETKVASQSLQAARAVGRCYGAIFFLVFGAAWFLLSAYAWRQLSLSRAIVLAGMAAILVAAVYLVQRRGKIASEGAYPPEEKQRNDRRFGIVNAVTWISVFLVFQVMPRLGHKELSIPAALILVGLHFFAMPPIYRHTANQVLGAFLVVWGIVCPLLWEGNPMIGYLAFGAGSALWLSAAWAVETARHLLISAHL